ALVIKGTSASSPTSTQLNNTNNDFSGGVTLVAGAATGDTKDPVLLIAGNTLGTGTLTVSGGTISNNSGAVLTIPNPISLGGTLGVGLTSGSNGIIYSGNVALTANS